MKNKNITQRVFSFLCLCIIIHAISNISANVIPHSHDIISTRGSFDEVSYYQDLAPENPPLELFRIYVDPQAITAAKQNPFICSVDICYMADLYDETNDTLIMTGSSQVRFTLYVHQESMRCVVNEKHDDAFDTLGKAYKKHSIISWNPPIFEFSTNTIILSIKNYGLDGLDGKTIAPRGILKNQQGFISYKHNGPQHHIFFNDNVLKKPLTVSQHSSLMCKNSCTIDANFHTIDFQQTHDPLWIIDPNQNVLVRNIVLKNFSPNHVKLHDQAHLTFGDNTRIDLTDNEQLSSSWNMQGRCVINGNGKELTLNSLGSIIATQPNTSILFDNIVLSGLRNENISCLDATCTISFRNTTLKLAQDVHFSQGHFEILNQVKIQGHHHFIYNSPNQSIIWDNSMLTCHHNTHFIYAPTTPDNNLIACKDITSSLLLNNASLTVTTTGFDFTHGTLIIKNNANIYNDNAQSISEGVILKNITLLNNANVSFKSGIITIIE